MRNEYIDIPAQPQPRQEYLWQRQALAEDIRLASIEVNESTARYVALINAMIELNDKIRESE